MKSRLVHLATVFALALAVVVLLSACVAPRGSGNIVTESRTVGNVKNVELSGIGRLEITQGSPSSLFVEADDNLMSYIKTETRGDTLVISMQARGLPLAILEPSRTIVYRLQTPDLSSVKLSGSGQVISTGIDTSSLEIDISGSGSLDLTDVKAARFTYRLSGSGKATMSGEVDQEDVEVSGSGRLDATDLRAKTASVDINGSGRAVVWVTDQLDINIAGSGDVQYYGSPRVNQNIAGSGSIRSLGAK